MADDPAPGTGQNYPDPTPQTNTAKQNSRSEELVTPEPSLSQNISFTPEQFDALIARLNTGNLTDQAPAPSMGGLQTNPFGQVVGTVTKFNIDPAYYPSPVDKLLEFCNTDSRMRRHNVSENFYISYDITARPYPTKDNLMVQEPTFSLTLYANEYDEDGKDTGRFIVIQTLHMNEDEELCRIFASEEGIEVSDTTLKQLMDDTRYERARQWLVGVFYPPRNFEMNIQEGEEAIGGSVVRVVTKSNVKGFGNPIPKIKDEELS